MGKSQGIQSRNNVSPKIKTGVGSRKVSPYRVAAQGSMKGDHAEMKGNIGFRPSQINYYTGKGMDTCRYGNEVALNSKSAPGQGRTIYKTGSQSGLDRNPKPQTSSNWANSYPPSKRDI